MAETEREWRGRLAGLAEVAQILHVTKRAAARYAAQGDLPEPYDRLACGPVWKVEAIEKLRDRDVLPRTSGPSAANRIRSGKRAERKR